MSDYVLERRDQADFTPLVGRLMITPRIDDEYWTYRVRLTERQAILGFPKFLTIGIGFAVEDDWNTNLPYTSGTEEIYDHISHNAGDPAITRQACLEAIRLVQAAAAADRRRGTL